MRRDRLKMLTHHQVEAMNPSLPGEHTPKHLSSYYDPWNRLPSSWHSSPGRLFTVPFAIYWRNITPNFRHGYFDLAGYDREDGYVQKDPLPDQWVQISINMNRSNPVILRDLEIALKEARKRYPPVRKNPRMKEWKDSQILQVWDLREFGLSWEQIIEQPGIIFSSREADHYTTQDNILQSAKNAYRSAHLRIEGKEWKLYAFQVVDSMLHKQSADKHGQKLIDRIAKREVDSALKALDEELDK